MLLSAEASRVVARLAKAIPGLKEDRKVLGLALDTIGALFGATGGGVYVYKRGTGELHKVKSLSADSETGSGARDPAILMSFYRNEKPRLEANVIMAPVRAGETVVGVLALAKAIPFEPGAGKTATEILKAVGGILAIRKRAYALEAETSVANAILRGVDAGDIVYRVFHQLRRLIDYDHGATLIKRIGDSTGRVVARQVAWTKGKSDFVGKVVALDWREVETGIRVVPGTGSPGSTAGALSAIREAASPPPGQAIFAPVEAGGGLLGCVEIASKGRSFFTRQDEDLLAAFLPHLGWCLKETK